MAGALVSICMDVSAEAWDHCHAVEPGRERTRQARRQLTAATVLCAIFVTGEVVGGWYSGSLAIMGDAAHMFSDLASFGLSLLVLWLADKPPTKRMTFGYHRAEALGALATLCIIWYVTGILVYLAVSRLHSGEFEIHSTAMLVVAAAAVCFNLLLGFTLHGVPHSHSHGGGGGHSHGGGQGGQVGSQINIRAALIHVLGDLLQSIGVLISSLCIKFWGEDAKVADPICTLVFAVIVVCTTMSVLRDSLAILLDAAPTRLSYDTLEADLLGVKQVERVHSLHLWSLTADLPVVSCHLATLPGADQDRVRSEAQRLLRTKHRVYRTTIQASLVTPFPRVDIITARAGGALQRPDLRLLPHLPADAGVARSLVTVITKVAKTLTKQYIQFSNKVTNLLIFYLNIYIKYSYLVL